jgi:hypothetical protein
LYAQEASRVDEIDAYQSLRDKIDTYLEVNVAGDVEALKPMYHEDANLNALILGDWLTGTPQILFDALAERGSPRLTGEPVDSVMTYLHRDGDVATAEVQFVNYWCGTGTHHLQLVRSDEDWKIVSTLIWFRAMPDSDQTSEACAAVSQTPPQ